MIDRRMVTDFALALLIALPAILPAAPSPWSLYSSAGYTPPETIEAATASTDATAWAGSSKWDRGELERRS